MKLPLHQILIQKIRQRTPLKIRHVIGPILSFLVFKINIYFRRNRKIPKVLSKIKTAEKVYTEELSMIRFGDGEITYLEGVDLAFQKYDKNLADRLISIIKTNELKILICIPGIWEGLDKLKDFAYKFNIHHLYRYGHIWNSILSFDRVYGDTNITRPYLAYKDKDEAGIIFEKLFSIWKNKDIILIEGSKSRLGVGNNMFSNTKSLGRILCPPENSFEKYSEILNEATKTSNDKLVLISLGPTAKVLAYDLFKLGYRVLDIGHIDMEYEMFRRNAEKQVKVKYKYFNEIHERNPEECTDPEYLKQIIKVIE